jgi:hypothetical protein
MSEHASSSPATRTSTAPRPLAPIDGQHVDASAVPFSWSDELPGPYVFQLARDEQFEDVIATITAGDASSLTLYDTLDVGGDSDVFWRVRSGERGAWCAPAHFVAADMDRVRADRAEQDRLARQRSREALQQHLADEDRVPVVLPEKADLSDRGTAIILGVIVISFILLLVILMVFGQVTYPAEAVV